jgi:RNA polymerase sigma-70 factor (ECF subfamily)
LFSLATRLNDLIDAVAEGDRAALEQLYRLTGAKLYGVTLRILRRSEPAEEALEDAFLRIWQEAGEFDPRADEPVAFLAAAARRSALGLARRRGENGLEAEMPALDAEFTPPKPSDELKRLLAALAGLSADLRRMLLLAYYDGWSRQALAVEFDAPAGTVATWLRRCLAEIRERV